MKIAIDVYYYEEKAKAVAIEFLNWEDELPIATRYAFLDEVAPYVPGQFFQRELPCILKVLEHCDLTKAEVIIVDGYVLLDSSGKQGLGAHLFEALGGKIPIIGVAKRGFRTKEENIFVKEVYRGESKNPLYVSSMGIALEKSAGLIQDMSGAFRIPNLLKILDQETKTKT